MCIPCCFSRGRRPRPPAYPQPRPHQPCDPVGFSVSATLSNSPIAPPFESFNPHRSWAGSSPPSATSRQPPAAPALGTGGGARGWTRCLGGRACGPARKKSRRSRTWSAQRWVSAAVQCCTFRRVPEPRPGTRVCGTRVDQVPRGQGTPQLGIPERFGTYTISGPLFPQCPSSAIPLPFPAIPCPFPQLGMKDRFGMYKVRYVAAGAPDGGPTVVLGKVPELQPTQVRTVC